MFLADRVLVMSARPGRIVAERTIPFARPRTLDITYTEPFQAIVHELRDRINEARAGVEIDACSLRRNASARRRSAASTR